MLTPDQKRQNLKTTFKEIAHQLWQLRYSKDISMEDLALKTKIPLFWLDALERRQHDINIGYLVQLAAFYDKRLKLDLVDVEEAHPHKSVEKAIPAKPAASKIKTDADSSVSINPEVGKKAETVMTEPVPAFCSAKEAGSKTNESIPAADKINLTIMPILPENILSTLAAFEQMEMKP